MLKPMKPMVVMLVLSLGGLAPLQADWTLGERDTLGFHGYFRGGFGQSGDGDQPVTFGLPGAGAKYRLGNESDTNMELALDYRHHLDGVGEGGRYLQVLLMADGYAPYGDTFRIDEFPQSYVNFANFLGDGVEAWVGRRYYDRKETLINDHFWLNTGQRRDAGMGAGVQGMRVGPGVLKLAAFQAVDTAAGDTESSLYDLRLADIPTNPGGQLTLWGLGAERHGGRYLDGGTPVDLNGRSGFGIGLWHDQRLFDGKGSNTLALIYREGAAVPRSDFNHNPLINSAGVTDARTVEINDTLLIETDPDWSLQWTAVYRDSELVDAAGVSNDIRWFSTGVRPVYYFTDHLNLAFELGYDHVDNRQTRQEGGLTKATLALQLAPSRGFFSRPVLRLYATHAAWDGDFKGEVGGPTYADATEGSSLGLQAEWWW